jgi:hypothetical protein
MLLLLFTPESSVGLVATPTQTSHLIIKFNEMKGWPTGQSSVVVRSSGGDVFKDVDLSFNLPQGVVSARLCFYIYCMGYGWLWSRSIEDIELNGYVIGKQLGLFDDNGWTNFTINKEFMRPGNNSLFIRISVDYGEFYIYDISMMDVSRTIVTMKLDCSPRVSPIEVDGTIYPATLLPKSFIFDMGSVHTIVVAPQVYQEDNRTRYVFVAWGDGNMFTSRAVSAFNDSIYIAEFRTEFYLDIGSQYGAVTGLGWHVANSSTLFSLTPAVVEYGNSTKHIFVSWTGDVSTKLASGNVTMDSPKSMEALWTTQYYLTLKSDYGDPIGGGWYGAGESVTCSLSSPVSYENGTRRNFVGWTGDISSSDPNIEVVVDRPKVLNARWGTQYYLTVLSEVGTVTGQGWYDAGASTHASVSTQEYDQFPFVYHFKMWSQDSQGNGLTSDPVLMDGPKVAKAVWDLEFSPLFYATAAGTGILLFLASTIYAVRAYLARRARDTWHGKREGVAKWLDESIVSTARHIRQLEEPKQRRRRSGRRRTQRTKKDAQGD